MNVYILVHRESYEGDSIFGVYNDKEIVKRALSEAKEVHPIGNFKVLEVAVNEDPEWDCYKIVELL